MNGEEIQTEKYSSLLVSPVHIHKNKVLHKKAILALGEEIVQHIHQREMNRVEFLADTASSKVAVEH